MSLKVWLPLISDTNSIGLIREGITPHNISTYSASKFGTAAQLNGSNGYIEGSVYTTATMTYMCWVYFDTLKGCHLLDCRTSAGNGYQPMYINPSSGVQVGGSTSAFPYIAYTFAAAKWYHIAVTYSTTKCQLFVNGALVGESTSGKGTAINADRPFYLGCRCTQINWAHARVNDFRIYDHTCSTKEIAEVARGLFLHYKMDQVNPNMGNGSLTMEACASGSKNIGKYGAASSTVKRVVNGITQVVSTVAWQGAGVYAAPLDLVVGNNYTFSCTAYTNDTTNAKISFYPMMHHDGSRDTTSKMPISVMGGAFTDANSKAIGSITTTPTRYWATFTWNQTMADILADTGGYIILTMQLHGTFSTGTEMYMQQPKLEPGNIPTRWCGSLTDDGLTNDIIYDCSGYGNHGSVIGLVEAINASPRYSHGTYINSPNATDGTATGAYYIDAPCNLGKPQTISVTWWCDPIAGYSSATANGIWCTTANGTGSDYTTSAFNHRDLAFNVNSADGAQHLRPSTSSMTTGEWHHYALVYNGRTVTFYKDGVSQTSASFTADTALGNMTKLLIGISRAGSVNRKVKAYYSDFRVYVTALTAQQVEDLYNEQVAIGRTAAIFAREIVEDSSIAVTHNGQLTANSFQETGTTAFFKKNGTVKGSDIYEY